MSAPTLNAGISALDRAHALRLGGDATGAARLALTLLEAATEQLGAACLLGHLLIDGGRPIVAAEAMGRLVDAYTRRGDLPAAVVAAHLVAAAGEDAGPLFSRLAGAFGKDAPRRGGSLHPPPLPKEVEVPKHLARLSGDQLFDRAEEALQKFLGSEDPVAADLEVPEWPLFGALAAAPLARLLEALTLRDAAQDEAILREGDDGQEAFVLVRGMVRVERQAEEDPVVLAALGPGSLFGEMALVSDTPRAASVVAVEPAQLLVADRDALEALAATEPVVGRELARFCHDRMVSNLIRHSAILGSVAPEDRAGLMARFTTRTFEQGDCIVAAGQVTEGLFVVASGAVRVVGRDDDGDDIALATLGPGEVFGEISLVLRRPASADVIAAHPTVALELTREQFQEAIREHPDLLGELYELATQREEETQSLVGQKALDVDDVVLL